MVGSPCASHKLPHAATLLLCAVEDVEAWQQIGHRHSPWILGLEAAPACVKLLYAADDLLHALSAGVAVVRACLVGCLRLVRLCALTRSVVHGPAILQDNIWDIARMSTPTHTLPAVRVHAAGSMYGPPVPPLWSTRQQCQRYLQRHQSRITSAPDPAARSACCQPRVAAVLCRAAAGQTPGVCVCVPASSSGWRAPGCVSACGVARLQALCHNGRDVCSAPHMLHAVGLRRWALMTCCTRGTARSRCSRRTA